MSKTVSPANELHDTSFLLYIKQKSWTLTHSIWPYLDYRGATIAGSAFGNDAIATSAFVFILNSIRSRYKDVVPLIPTKTMNAEVLHDMRNIIWGL